jgi:hypothetical protein
MAFGEGQLEKKTPLCVGTVLVCCDLACFRPHTSPIIIWQLIGRVGGSWLVWLPVSRFGWIMGEEMGFIPVKWGFGLDLAILRLQTDTVLSRFSFVFGRKRV